MRPNLFPYKFAYVEIGRSAKVPTLLTKEEIIDTFIEYGHKTHSYDKIEKEIVLRKNFVVKLNTHKLNRKKYVTFDFFKYNKYQFIWLAPIHTLIIFLPISLISILILALLYTLIVFLLIRVYEKIRFKELNYSEEANKTFLEILSIIREKEMERYGQCIRE